MSSPPADAREHICYRCRKTASKNKDLIACHFCTLYWHLECIPPPLPPMEKEWMCPRHQKPFDPKKRSSKRSSKSKARADIIESFEEADEINKYGGVIHDITEETIENEFLAYAKRYREFNRYEKKAEASRNKDVSQDNDIKIKVEAEEWLDSLTPFEAGETHNDGIQMLLDAANRDSDKSEFFDSRKAIELEEGDYRRFEAIQELINLKGEDALLELLSQQD